MSYRVATGFDIHRLVPGPRRVPSGTELPRDTGPAGHSDGDAILHTVADARLGAAGWKPAGLDLVIATEGARIPAYRAAMRAFTTELVGLEPDPVNVKGKGKSKSLEGLGVPAAAQAWPCRWSA